LGNRVHKGPQLDPILNQNNSPLPHHTVSQTSILILYTLLHLGLPSCLFPFGSATNVLLRMLPCFPFSLLLWGGGVRLGPLGPLYRPRMRLGDDGCRAVDGMRLGRGNRSTGRKPAPNAALSTINPT
jgi:hypothetical protein